MRRIVNGFHRTSVRFNNRFAGGFAKHEVEKGLSYIDSVFRSAQASLPPKLTYESLEVCSPEKAFSVFSEYAKNDRRYIYDFARNDFYLVQFNFSFEGVTFPIYMNMMFTNESDEIYIRDKPFHIKPVLADPLISVSGDGLFLPLNQTNMTTRARSHFVFKGDDLIQVKVHETTIHHTLREVQSKDNKESRMRITCNAHYLFCKEGYKDTFLRFNAIVEAGFKDTVNLNTHPSSEWTIYSSTQEYGNEPQMTDTGERLIHGVRLAVRNKDINRDVESVIGAFFYILDLLPDVEDVNHLNDGAWWIVKMGKIILGTEFDHRILFRKMEEHYKTIWTYIDGMSILLMHENNIFINDIYGYLEWGIYNFDEYINRPESSQSTMYGKYLMVSRYIFKPVREAIFFAIYDLRKKPDKLTLREVRSKLKSRVRLDLVMKINSKCPNVGAVISSTDSRLLKTGIEIVPQDNMRMTRPNKTTKMLRNPKWQWDPSYIDAGGFASMSKNEPIGKDAGNFCMNIDMDGKISQQEEGREILEKVARMTRTD